MLFNAFLSKTDGNKQKKVMISIEFNARSSINAKNTSIAISLS